MFKIVNAIIINVKRSRKIIKEELTDGASNERETNQIED